MNSRRPTTLEHECPCGRTVVFIVHTDPGHDVAEALHRLEQTVVTNQAEVLAKLAELKKDTQRIIAKLKAALEEQDLTAIAAAVDELDAAIEAADPEEVEPPTP